MGRSGPKFFCDEQLGKLARWLRIIGVDAEYEREIEDSELLCRARREQRTVLTRDTNLAGKAGDVKVICLETNYPAHQLREVVELFKDSIDIDVFSRCVACNGEIEEIEKAEVKDKVPPYVFKTQQKFTKCKSCGKIYWQATHRDRVELALKDVLSGIYTE